MDFSNILFLDIETVPQYEDFHLASKQWQEFWQAKSERIAKNPDDDAISLFDRAGIYAEFGKIVCISVAYHDNEKIYVKSFFSKNDEAKLLEDFTQMLDNFQSKKNEIYLCAHNGKEFDFPYIARRMIVNRLPLPEVLNLWGKKPWEVRHLDTMEMWKFGDHKSFTSIDLLAYILGLSSPKSVMKGSDVYQKFYKENDLDAIVEYCQQDVITVVQLLRVFFRLDPISSENIILR